MTTTDNLAAALDDCVYVVGTTSRDEVERRETVDPEEAVRRLYENAARGRVALLLGGEKRRPRR